MKALREKNGKSADFHLWITEYGLVGDAHIAPAKPQLSMGFAGAIVRTQFSLTFIPATDS